MIHGMRDHSAADGRPSATDALEVLRLAVGLTPSFGPATPEAFVAADMNRDSQITAQDALEVLRAAVGLSSDNGPQWLFVDSDAFAPMDRNSVTQDTGITVDALDGPVSDLQLTAILTGHMSEFG